jgi:hypothetical protein
MDGPVGTLGLLMDVFRLTAFVGEQVGIDPGRPGVPDYGSRIYHLGPTPGTRQRVTNTASSAIQRKLAARGTLANPDDFEIVAQARDDYILKLQDARFGALVTDFDGTIVPPGIGCKTRLSASIVATLERLLGNDTLLYFATGRGDSIHSIISSSLNRKFHARVFISYYNGSITQSLVEAPPKPEGGPHHIKFDQMLRWLKADPLIARIAKPENKSFQLTLKAASQAAFPAASTAMLELIARQTTSGQFRIVQSSHSLDVIACESNKLNCVRLAQSRLPKELKVLTLGDRGALPGNDFDLLTHPLSLSVDTVSADLGSCWNLLPAGCRNVAGFLEYCQCLVPRGDCFTLCFR